MNDTETDTLHWRALNYRTAATEHADLMWRELEDYVERQVLAEREQSARIVEDWPYIMEDREAREFCAAAIRAGTI